MALTDIFKAYDIRGTYPDKINETAAWQIGCAAGRFLMAHPERPKGDAGKTVLISRDMRKSSPSLCQAMVEGLRAADCNVVDLGMCDTSFMYFAVNRLGAAGGIQVTASHNPPQYNGAKLSGPLAKPIGGNTGLKDILAIAQTLGERGSIAPTGSYRQQDLWSEYRTHVLKFLKPLKRKLKVFIDASNGMGGKMLPVVFKGVPNLEIIELNYEITGDFVHEPNPLVAENMVPTQQGVRQHGANLGACFDGDADRCMIADDQGNTIGCDHLTALLTGHFAAEPGGKGATIIYDLRSSKVVEETIRAHGCNPVRSRVGHVFMKSLLRETSGIFGGELSGHFYFRDNFFADSGAITLAVVLSVLGNTDRSLSDLIRPLRKYPQSGEQNFRTADKDAVLAWIKSEFAGAKMDELDGVTVDSFDKDGFWFNIRASNTEPLLRLNAEARNQATLDKLLSRITPRLGERAAGH